ncbi:MAG: hypothetical protein PHQ75_10495 [Thermoguttaceae bacterium]|nr:hypothetical protein [Thermoguttaceae bacterium]
MAIHIHLFDCNCIFCGSDFPLDFFQSHNDDGQNTQSATVPQDESDPLDDCPDTDDNDHEDDWDDSDDEDDEDDEEDDEKEIEEEPKPNDKKKIFGFLIGKHNVCVL